MSSKNKTPLGLSQWEGTDTPQRMDFNSDNLLVDTKLSEKLNISEFFRSDDISKVDWDTLPSGWYKVNNIQFQESLHHPPIGAYNWGILTVVKNGGFVQTYYIIHLSAILSCTFAPFKTNTDFEVIFSPSFN